MVDTRTFASTGPQKFKIDTTVPTFPAWTCLDAPVAAPLVEMSWNQQGTAYVAGYGAELDGDGWQVIRYTCEGLDAPVAPLPNMTTRNVTGRVHAADAMLTAPGRYQDGTDHLWGDRSPS